MEARKPDIVSGRVHPPNLLLLVVASAMEARAILRAADATEPAPPRQQPPDDWRPFKLWPGCDLLCCGIGKTNAAAATAMALTQHEYRAVMSIGVAGSLPGSGVALGDVIAATACVYADEGLESPSGFLDCHTMGFALGPFDGSAVPADPALLDLLKPFCDATGPIATVSTCSGTDARAVAVRARTRALAEAMEGAAVAHVAFRIAQLHSDRPLAIGELRVVSNTTGDRDAQAWDIKRSLSRLTEVVEQLRRTSLEFH